MKTLRSVADVRAELAGARGAGMTVGLVPTMGALHEGHLSLMRRAHQDCDLVVVSLFVNPAQFDEAGDLAAYPRDEARDARLAAEQGVDVLFAPSPREVYPDGFATTVHVDGISEMLEGVQRGARHFDAVATVVLKLFGMIGPDVAYFGQKDFQQTLVVRRMVSDLDLPVRIAVCPTVREADGLAMSSRNGRLSPDERRRAPALHRALLAAEDAVADGELDAGTIRAAALAELEAAGIEPEYLSIASAEDLSPLTRVDGRAVALIAARLGATRLIDNHLLTRIPEPLGVGARTTNTEVLP
jgi:pantoate--beta-alanine ligase